MSGSPTAKRSRVEAEFPIPGFPSKYNRVAIDPWATETLSADQRAKLQANVTLLRDTIVAFTASGAASGYGGHSGGAFDTVPEVVFLDAFFRGRPDKFVPVFYDEAGHRVATQYMLAALNGHIPAKSLLNYRRGGCGLPGHPELGHTPGVTFSSGRLGHIWPYINGVAMANPGKAVCALGSDGSQMEGNNAEAARLAVAKGINVKLFIDDNDVTITGHPSEYLRGFNLESTLRGHGVTVTSVLSEDLDQMYAAMRACVTTNGPYAVVVRRKMAPGVEGIEGTHQGHDVFPVANASKWLEARGQKAAADLLKTIQKTKDPHTYLGCGAAGSMRTVVGDTLTKIITAMPPAERRAKVLYIDSDLGSSTGIAKLEKAAPEVYCHSGVMERGNFSAAAGFGSVEGKQGIFSTFAAFLEMIISEVTMARLNRSNVLCHFSHCGVDDMADNTCHYGLNMFFADNGLDDGYETRLYFPCDALQAAKVTERIFNDKGMRFLYTTRSKTLTVLKEDGTPFYGPDFVWSPVKTDVIRKGTAGIILSYGDALYRCVDAVDRLKKEGINVMLLNKTTLNVVDEEAIKAVDGAPFLLVVESLGVRTSLGSRVGTWMLTRGVKPKKFAVIGTHREGDGGLWEHAYHQGYDSASVQKKVKELLA